MDFTEMYSEYYDQMKRTAKSFLHNEEDALDIVQDTFLEAYESMDSYNDSYSLSTWLTQICINKCRDKLRKRKTERKHIKPITLGIEHLLDSREDQDSPELLLQAAEDEQSIASAFINLPENIRVAMLLKFSDEYSYKEIADKMDVPINTVKTWVRRGRTKILQTFSPR